MTARVAVIGYDGAPLSARALEVLAEATLVAGGRRHLDAVPVPAGAERVVMGDVGQAVRRIAAHRGVAVVVASGDPGFFGIVRLLRRTVNGLELEVAPARSSVALAFAKAAMPWEDAKVVSAHGRDLRRAVNVCRAFGKVAVLTGPGAGPAELAAGLRDLVRTMVVCEELGTERERVVVVDAKAAAEREWADPNVTLVLGDGQLAPAGWLAGERMPTEARPRGWALAEEAFEHRDSMITKAEVRALALARLGPRVGDLLWDVGAGSGAVGIECAGFGAAVIAVERDPDACAMIRRNHAAAGHAAELAVVCGEAPAVLAELPEPDAVFVGGGGPDVLAACLARRPERVVLTLAAVQRFGAASVALAEAGYRADGVVLSAARLAPLPGQTHRLAATNPIFVLWGDRA